MSSTNSKLPAQLPFPLGSFTASTPPVTASFEAQPEVSAGFRAVFVAVGAKPGWTLNQGNLPVLSWPRRFLNIPKVRHNQWILNQGNLPFIWWWKNCFGVTGQTAAFAVQPLIQALFLTPSASGAFEVQPLIQASFIGNKGPFYFRVQALVSASFFGYDQITSASFSVQPLVQPTFAAAQGARSTFSVQPMISVQFSLNAGQQSTCITSGSVPSGGGAQNAVY